MAAGRIGEFCKGFTTAFDCLAAAVVFGSVVGPAEFEVVGFVGACVGRRGALVFAGGSCDRVS